MFSVNCHYRRNLVRACVPARRPGKTFKNGHGSRVVVVVVVSLSLSLSRLSVCLSPSLFPSLSFPRRDSGHPWLHSFPARDTNFICVALGTRNSVALAGWKPRDAFERQPSRTLRTQHEIRLSIARNTRNFDF